MTTFHYFEQDNHNTTVSKTDPLPSGDFRLTEYCWGPVSLWFIDSQRFTPAERQAAYFGFLQHQAKRDDTAAK